MLFMVVAHFKPGMSQKRQDLAGAFSEHLEQKWPRVHLGGPLSDVSGSETGLFLFVEAADKGQVDALIQCSPFTAAGVYDRLEISATTIEIGHLS